MGPRDRQANPRILAPAADPTRKGVIEKVEVAVGAHDEPDAYRPLAPVLARADEQFIGAVQSFPELGREHARQNKPMTRVVLLGLDGFPHRAISADLTPRMWELAQRGGRASSGGTTDLPSSTDPGFCSLLTGCRPSTHGVRTTSWRYAKLPAWAGLETPGVPTIFDGCRAAGIRTAAIVAA